MKALRNNTVFRKPAALLVALALGAAGCASAPSTSETDLQALDATFTGYGVVRKAAGVSQTAYVYANSVYFNPVIRPVTHVASLSSYVLKSSGGAMRRVAIASTQMPDLQGPVPELTYSDPMDLEAWERQLDEITQTQQSRGTIEFLVDGDEYFPRLEQAIDNATESIAIRTYIFDNDDYALSIADRIKARSDEVDARVIVDSVGNLQAMQTDSESQPNGHLPPLTMKYYFKRDSDVRLRRTPNPWLTGDHTKTTIIDRKIAFVGGMNIGREYRYDWHDLMMEVRGPVVNQLQHKADVAWARAGLLGDVAGLLEHLRGESDDAEDVGYPIRVLQTKDFDSDIYKAQLAAIRSARSYIMIQNAYFSDDRIVYELAQARRRGVDVRVILPEEGNHGVLDKSNTIAIKHMLQHGIRVYRYPGMSHMKAAIYDGWVCVGSANFDKLSLKVNKELNLATSQPGVARALLEQVFIPDLMASTEITAAPNVTITARIAEVVVDELL
jgi:cardiolipin synthase